MTHRLHWEQDGADWPNRGASRFVSASGVRWHVQIMGEGPVVLLLHGTGASTHSWRDVGPLLASSFTVVAPDLPGHAFSDPLPHAPTLPAMATATSALMRALRLSPRLLVGHSAGAAIALRATLDDLLTPDGVVSVNGALLPFEGIPGWLFAPAARLLVNNPFVPRFLAWRARDEASARRLIKGTGSTLPEEGIALYRRLITSPAHLRGTLAMMASWDLAPLRDDLSRLEKPLLLLTGSRDRTIPPEEARRQRALLPEPRW